MSTYLLIVGFLFFANVSLEEDLEEVVVRPQPVTTEHVIQLDGRDIHYTATAGTLPLYNERDGKVEAQIFHVAYMAKDADPATRPIFFLFNGGPGSSSVWLHLGAFGPKRVLTGDAVTTVGGDLAARYVIHAVGPNYRVWIGKRPSHEREAAATAADMALRRAYDASMREAKLGALLGETGRMRLAIAGVRDAGVIGRPRGGTALGRRRRGGTGGPQS